MMGRLRWLIVAVLFVGLAVVQGAGTSTAGAAAGDGVVTDPTDGQVIQPGVGYTGPITVQWNAAGNFAIVVTGPGGYSDEIDSSPTDANVGNSYVYPITAIPAVGTYQITITNSDTSEVVDTSSFVIKDYDAASLDYAPTHLAGWTGPVTVTWSHVVDPGNTYAVLVDGSVACSYAGTLTPGQVTHCTLPSAPAAGTHSLQAEDLTTADVLDGYTITVAPHLNVRSSTPSASFYPLVRDGYKDSVALDYRLNKAAKVSFQVKNKAGKIIRHTRAANAGAGSHVWKWNGSKDSGRIRKPGHYWLRVTAKAQGELKRGSWHRVTAKTAIVTHRAPAIQRLGRNFSSSGKSQCFINKNWWNPGDVFVDCWGGSAHVTYSFGVRGSAFNVTTGSSTKRYCCSNGTAGRTTTRPSARRVSVTFNVTNWASLAINTVSIHYSYKKRI